VREHPDVLGATIAPNFRVEAISHAPSDAGGVSTLYVRMIQVVEGVDVEGGRLTAVLKRLPGETRVIEIQGKFFPDVMASPAEFPSVEAARRRVSAADISSVRSSGRKIRWWGGRWRAAREFQDVRTGRRWAVDGGGEVLPWEDRHFARDISGRVRGRAVVFDPVRTGTDLPTVPLGDVTVSVPGREATTLSDGSFEWGGVPDELTEGEAKLTGVWSRVVGPEGESRRLAFPLEGEASHDILFNPVGDPVSGTAHTNAHYHLTRARAWLAARGIPFPPAGGPVTARVNLPGVCNAYYDGITGTLNFYQAGGGCINAAYDTVIIHEYAHAVDDAIGGITDRGLSEGWGDLLAAYVTGQPRVGEGFFGDDRDVRSADNTRRYQEGDAIHNQGQSWSGFAWDLRSRVGPVTAESLVLPTLHANAGSIPLAVRAVALQDDDDGDMSNGTPHLSDIRAAAARHGLDDVLDFDPPVIVLAEPTEGARVSGVIAVDANVTEAGTAPLVVFLIDGEIRATRTSPDRKSVV
jgi:hypothetical protein